MLLHGLKGMHGSRVYVPREASLQPDRGRLEERYAAFLAARKRSCRIWRSCHMAYGIFGGMEKTTVYLPDELKAALRRTARATGQSEAQLIREGVGLVTGAHRIAEPRLPLFESGQADLAERVDESLAGFGER